MDNYRDRLIYLKGFLDSISYLNTFDNDGKTYAVGMIEKVNADFQDTLLAHFNKKNWLVTTTLITGNWREVLRKDLRPYFDQIIAEVFTKTNRTTLFDERGHYKQGAKELIEKVRLDNSFYVDHLLQQKFLDCLEQIVGSEPQLYRVEIDWQPSDKAFEGYYEGYCNDFLFDMGNQVLFLHFGGSD
ncbi:MAG: hypothetical protein J7623_22610 [Chitinophaga sp.]|uniref:hypothetical protein n=1 Tax=Chitinophaga sp. TaxID=1869181 RepID=UPI001B2835BD|nr:hypothetical protein [Chitinophaga sp.]MBO9731450.1 hypothetical protein [Chitinophaga sp.]